MNTPQTSPKISTPDQALMDGSAMPNGSGNSGGNGSFHPYAEPSVRPDPSPDRTDSQPPAKE